MEKMEKRLGHFINIADFASVEAPQIEVRRYWNANTVREMCVRHHLYTTGTMTDYNDMLEAVNAFEPTDEVIYCVASDINRHSDYHIGTAYCMDLLLDEAVSHSCRLTAKEGEEG